MVSHPGIEGKASLELSLGVGEAIFSLSSKKVKTMGKQTQ
jgi:hypothetical protein